jgi:anti-sigma B factor antagonist
MKLESEFVIAEEREGAEAVCLKLSGALDRQTSPQLRRVMRNCFEGKTKSIHIALDGVPRMDSSGVATLVEGLRWSRASGNRFMLSGLTDAVRDLLVLSSLENEFELLGEGVGQ